MRMKWTTAVCIAFIMLLTLVYFNRQAIAMVGFDWFIREQIEMNLEQSYKPVEGREPKPDPSDQLALVKEEPYALLLLGVDQRENETGRSDTMLYTIVRPTDGRILLVALPRDLYVEIVDRGRKDKINSAFAYGGAGMAIDTVEQFLDAPVDHYVTINFEGFRSVIDEMGGIALPIEEDIENKDPNHEYFFIKGGQDSYDGNDALNYVRYREDAGGDLSRARRQQAFLHAMIDKATGLQQWTKIPSLIRMLGDNFSTDILPSKLVDRVQNMLGRSDNKLYSHTLEGNGHRLVENGPWYYFAVEEDLLHVQAMIDNWLDEATLATDLILPGEWTTETE